MLLAAFTSGLTKNPGQVMYLLPKTMDIALQIAITVYETEVEAEEKRLETFLQIPDHSVRSAVNMSDAPHGKIGTRNVQTRAYPHCYECNGLGQFARELAERLNNKSKVPNENDKQAKSERQSKDSKE
jgi:hypothetical protein